ncbi:MAG: hypothetical protein JWN52_3056 [Actinomycetia bacterium]|nr:hypothetical protein [Actinomycetes bacterium]
MSPEERRTCTALDLSDRTVDAARVTPDFRDGDFSRTDFTGPVNFSGAVFETRVDFSGCVFTERPDFSRAVFRERVFFVGARFEAGADFHEVDFERFANFENLKVEGEARFTGAMFRTGLTMENSIVKGDLRFDRADFPKTSQMGPLTATRVDLRLAVFPRRVRMMMIADEIRCERSMFTGGVQFLLGGADIVLKDSELGPASLLAMHTGLHYHEDRPPRLVTLSGTDVSHLTISRVDLSACKFIYAHNVDKLRVNADDAFGWTPQSLWITRRQISGDEVRWRALYGSERGRRLWRPPSSWPDLGAPATASQVIKSYRALRKAREEAKDEPGAADFYYGEMDMRRLGKRLEARDNRRAGRWRGWLSSRGEYTLLWLYWLTSGYGLRAWRAFTALAVVAVLSAGAFDLWGFPTSAHHDYAYCLQFTLRAATSFLRGTDQTLSTAGQWMELALRLIGPLLFGLAVLALRGRVKR